MLTTTTLLLVTLAVCGAAAWDPIFFDHGLAHEVQIHDKMWVAFEVINDDLHVALATASTGWAAFGPSETGNMIRASFCVIMEENDNVTAVEHHSEEMGPPTRSASNNCVLHEFSQQGGETFAYFSRPMVGCKPEGIDINTYWDTKYIAAFGAELGVFTYHGVEARATVRLDVINGPHTWPELPDDVEIYDGFVDDWETDADRDIYYCKGHRFEFPNNARHHVVAFGPVLDTSDIAPAFHHHLILYSCPWGDLPPGWDDMQTKECSVAPPGGCVAFFVGWAIGQEYIDVRPAGYPIGGGPDPVHSAVIAQAHVDHPTGETGIHIPPWGLRIWHTPTMQEFEGVTFGFYLGFNKGIPAGEPYYEYRAEIAPSLLQAHIPEEGVVFQIISAHAHGLQVGWKLKIIRDGVEMPELGYTQQSWDYNTQDGIPRSLDHELRIFPDDRIIYSCIYDTTSKNETTFWGEGFEDEMCILYNNVYPNFSNKMTTLYCDGRTPGVDDPDSVVVCGALGNEAPYQGRSYFNQSYIPAPPPPNVCH